MVAKPLISILLHEHQKELNESAARVIFFNSELGMTAYLKINKSNCRNEKLRGQTREFKQKA